MKRFLFPVFVMILFVTSCDNMVLFPAEILSAEYVSENTCKIAYRGDWSKESFESNIHIVNNDDRRAMYYYCKKYEALDSDWFHSTAKTYYLLWQADRNWDHGKTIRVTGPRGSEAEFYAP